MILGSDGLAAEAIGEVELEGKVLVIKRIQVTYRLTTPTEERDKVERAYAIHKENCPVYRSLCAAIEITTELDWRGQK